MEEFKYYTSPIFLLSLLIRSIKTNLGYPKPVLFLTDKITFLYYFAFIVYNSLINFIMCSGPLH